MDLLKIAAKKEGENEPTDFSKKFFTGGLKFFFA